MSENVEGQDQTPEMESKEPEVNVSELVSRVERMEQSNKRLLDESKTWKQKYQNVRSEQEEKETQVLAEKNDFKGLWEKSQQEIGALKDELIDSKKNSLETALQFEVAKFGKDAEDTDILLAAVKTKKRDVLGFDKEAKKWQGVDVAVEELRKSNPGLFKSTVPGMETGRPGSAVEKEKTVEELINEDPMAVLKTQLAKIL